MPSETESTLTDLMSDPASYVVEVQSPNQHILLVYEDSILVRVEELNLATSQSLTYATTVTQTLMVTGGDFQSLH